MPRADVSCDAETVSAITAIIVPSDRSSDTAEFTIVGKALRAVDLRLILDRGTLWKHVMITPLGLVRY